MSRGNRGNSTLDTRTVLYQEIPGEKRGNGTLDFTYANSSLSGDIRRRNVDYLHKDWFEEIRPGQVGSGSKNDRES